MTEPLQRIPAGSPLDARGLFELGMAQVRTLAHRSWTDHNTHDPGVTINEVLAYALTELGFRASLPIEDLVARAPMAAPDADPQDAPEPSATPGDFHRAAQVLPNAALTERDWRKLVIDLSGVKNAWWLAHDGALLFADPILRRLWTASPGTPGVREARLAGLFDVRIDFMDDVTTQARRDEIVASVRERVERWRGLCQDVVTIEQVPTQDIALCAEIELEPGTDPTEAAARLLFDTEQALAPAVPSRSLDEMRALGRASHEIFVGPMLANGFIDDADLDASVLRERLRLSDFIAVARRVPGVRSVRELSLQPVLPDSANVLGPVPSADPWRIDLPAGHLPRRSEAFGRLVLTQRGVPVSGWNMAQMPAAVKARLDALLEAARLALETPRAADWPVPAGRERQVAPWRSVQLDLPETYGIGPAGLPPRSELRRLAQALQLQSFLLLFDQVMADDAVTLSEARARLSVDPQLLQALADELLSTPDIVSMRSAQRVSLTPAQLPDAPHDPPIDLYGPGLDATALARLAESPAESLARIHRLLDHQLARLGEDMADDASFSATLFGRDAAFVAADKARFVADAARLSRQRGVAFVQRPGTAERRWNTNNVTGAERRICARLGIANAARRNLATTSYDLYAEIDSTPGDEFRFRVRHRVSGDILLSSSTNYLTHDDARAKMMQAIARGQDPAAYQRLVATDGRHYFNIVDAANEVIARRIQYFDDPAEMEAAINRLRAYLLEHYSGEGMFLVEHILLRPRDASDALMPICMDSDCTDCSDDDPYSWRVHVVLPAEAGRFRDMGFRRFAEQVIRSELPAHVCPKVCWVDADDMARVEGAWHAWLDAHDGGPGASQRAQLLATLIEVLFSVRNVYPTNALFDCAADEAKPYFMLGRTALGSEGGTD